MDAGWLIGKLLRVKLPGRKARDITVQLAVWASPKRLMVTGRNYKRTRTISLRPSDVESLVETGKASWQTLAGEARVRIIEINKDKQDGKDK